MASPRRARGAGAARKAALSALMLVLADNRSLTEALGRTLPGVASAEERGLAQELAFGVMRWLPRLEAWVSLLVQRPLRSRDRDIHFILLLGLYQLAETRIPPHAAVHTAVSLARESGKSWASGLVNAALRRFQAEGEGLRRRAAASPAATYAHPDWLLTRFRDAWPQHWQSLADAGNARPPMTLRVNRRRLSRDAYRERLDAEQLSASPHPHAADALVMTTPVAVDRLPGFADGLVSVQDAAGQLAADLIRLAPGQRVLDVCAAPGSKSCHLLEREPDLEQLTALDIDDGRLNALRDNLARLALSARVLVGDGLQPEAWWDGRPYQRILLDAPCSATGVIRRHPDIKFLRRSSDIPRLVDTQQRLLESVWPLLEPEGILVYATCSVLPEENVDVIRRFLEARSDASIEPLGDDWGMDAGFGRQILTGMADMDGFYYAVLRKV